MWIDNISSLIQMYAVVHSIDAPGLKGSLLMVSQSPPARQNHG